MLLGGVVRRLGRYLRRGTQFIVPLLGWAVVFVLPVSAPAQNTDTLILENGRRFTVIDQITDPAEREALLKIYRGHAARKSRSG